MANGAWPTKVSAGNRWRPTADWVNNVTEATSQIMRSRPGGAIPGVGNADGRPGIVQVYNDSGIAVPQWGALAIDSVLITPAGNLSSFSYDFIVTGVTPTVGYTGQFVVLAQPLAAGDIGDAFGFGICPAMVDLLNAGDLFADVKASDSTQLESSSQGGAQILYSNGSTGSQLCLIRLGVAPTSSGTFAVKLEQNGGSAGSHSATCSYTYDVYDLQSGDKIGSMISPISSPCRVVMCQCLHAATRGSAYYDPNDGNALTIGFAWDETATQSNCS